MQIQVATNIELLNDSVSLNQKLDQRLIQKLDQKQEMLESNFDDPATSNEKRSLNELLESLDETLNSLILTDRLNKVRHDYKKLHTSKLIRRFAKAAKVIKRHQIETIIIYEQTSSKSQVHA